MFARVILVTAALLSASSVRADWTHPRSGMSLPDSVGDMHLGQERDSLGDGMDVVVQYGTATEPVTIYVYRSSHPNPALWFDRTRVAMADNVGEIDRSVSARPFTLGPVTAANGLRAEFRLPGQPWRATAVALAQHGAWIVKARVTSQTLDPTGVGKRMDALLAAVRFAGTPSRAPLPLTLPAACIGTPTLAGKIRRGEASLAVGAAIGVIALADAHLATGGTGPAGKPGEWCRQDVGRLAKSVTWYRKLDGTAWTALLGDAGMTASAYAFPKGMKAEGAAVFFSRTGPAMLVELYDALPDLKTGAGAALELIAGRRQPLATIGTAEK